MDLLYPHTWADNSDERWWQSLSSSPRSNLVLDFDGTLAPFSKDRTQVRMYPGVSDRLQVLGQNPRTRVVFVSGRPARELLMLLPSALKPEVWGSHGRERLLPNGDYSVETATMAQVQALVLFEHLMLEMGYKTAVERKPGSVAVHSRGLQATKEEQLRKAVLNSFEKVSSSSRDPLSLECLRFDGGIEVRILGCTKATAVRQIVDGESADTVFAYLGDDQTDEDAFRELQARGLCVLVRNEVRATLANLWLRPPVELLAFLDRWIATTAPHAQLEPEGIQS